jgi:adenylosuccinate synthase
MALDLEQKVWEGLRDFERLAELDFTPTTTYSVATRKEVLGHIIKEHDIIAAVGGFFGDESKGKNIEDITQALMATAESGYEIMVLRDVSGANAGHTNVINGKKIIFHLVPSGILVKGVACYIGEECVVDPVAFVREEISKLVEHKIDYKNKLFIGNVHVVTPYHKLMDVMRNIGYISGVEDLSKLILKNVSTLQGIAPVHGSKAWKNGPRLDDFWNLHYEEGENELRRTLEEDMLTYKGMLLARDIKEEDLLKVCESLNKDMERVPDYIVDFLKAEGKVQYLIDLYKHEVRDNELFPKRNDAKWEIQMIMDKGGKLLIEGPQSYWLSNSISKHWKSATSANTTAGGVLAASGVNLTKYKFAVVNVHKAPISSRIGRGANPAGFARQTYFSERGIRTLRALDPKVCANIAEIQKKYWESVDKNGILKPTKYTDETGETYLIGEAMAIASAREYGEHGSTSFKPRMTGLFDCVAHAAVEREQGDYTSISAVDRGDILDKVGVVIAYAFYHPDNPVIESEGTKYVNGMVIRPGDSYPNEKVLKHCYPIIKLIDGWKDTPIAAGKWDGKTLPKGVHEFIATIEHFTGTKVISIGNGPEAGNLIYLKRNEDKTAQDL